MKRIASGLRHMQVEFDFILSSPLVRARQTAEIVAKTYDIKDKLVLTPALLPEAPGSQIINEINEKYSLYRQRRFDRAPAIPEHADLHAHLRGPTLSITLKKGGLCRLCSDHLRYDRCATLEWLLYPSQIDTQASLD